MSYSFYVKENKAFKVTSNNKVIFYYSKDENTNIEDPDMKPLSNFGWRALTLIELVLKMDINEKFINIGYSYDEYDEGFIIKINYQNEAVRGLLTACYYIDGHKIYLRSANNPEISFVGYNSLEFFIRGEDRTEDDRVLFLPAAHDNAGKIIKHIDFINQATIADILLMDLSARFQ